MSKIFVTSRANKGLEVVAGKYQFIDGVFAPNDADFDKLEPILTRFYGVTVEDNDRGEYEKAVENYDPAILAQQTKAAEESGMAASTEAALAAGEAAGDPNVTGTLSPGSQTERVANRDDLAGAAAAAGQPASGDPKQVDPKVDPKVVGADKKAAADDKK